MVGLGRSPNCGVRAPESSVQISAATKGSFPREGRVQPNRGATRRNFSSRMSVMQSDYRRRTMRTDFSRCAPMQRARWSRCIAITVSRLEMVLESGGVRCGVVPCTLGLGLGFLGEEPGAESRRDLAKEEAHSCGPRRVAFGWAPFRARVIREIELSFPQREEIAVRADGTEGAGTC